MKLVELKCKNCHAKLEINPELNEYTCKYCDASFKVDDEIKHIKLDDMEQKGYEFEMGRIRAQRENQKKQYKKKNIFWLVMAWIFLFPIMITYYILKSDKIEKKKKFIIITILWIIFFMISDK